ncbi:MAG: hypothetical protein F6J93_34545 [Oscillatoria sp. SIO1A7]|nr:hypothetical protein [Oscillatoria sp. SIO1A7]
MSPCPQVPVSPGPQSPMPNSQCPMPNSPYVNLRMSRFVGICRFTLSKYQQ